MNANHVLDREECLALLSDQSVGRLAVIVGGVPEIFPVNYVLDGDAVVFRTNTGTKLEGTTHGVASFEVDLIDSPTRTGWSVVVHGIAQEVTAVDRADVVERLLGLPLGVWAAGAKPHVMRLPAERVSGRRVGPSAA